MNENERAPASLRMRLGRAWQIAEDFCVRFWVKKLWKKKTLAALLLVMVPIWFVERTRPFELLKGALVDAFASSSTSDTPKDLLIVQIDRDDYKDLFDGKSPLYPAGVMQLIKAVKSLPSTKVVGVDIDTSDLQWACEPLGDDLIGSGSQVVWAAVPLDSHGSEVSLAPVVGGRVYNQSQIGLARLPQDEDGYVRAFYSGYAVSGGIPHYHDASSPLCQNGLPTRKPDEIQALEPAGEMAAFFRVIAKPGTKFSKDEEKKYLRFTGDRNYNFHKVSASHFIRRDDNGTFHPQKLDATGAQRFQPSIVLIGGVYLEARDEYYTPLGPMSGVELLANGVESEIQKAISEVGFLKAFSFDLVATILILLIYFVYPERPLAALVWCGLAIVGAIVAAVWSYYFRAAFLNIVPIMLGMVVHQMYEGTEQALELKETSEKLEENLEKAEKEIARLENELGAARLHAKATGVPAETTEAAARVTIVRTEIEQVHVESAVKTKAAGESN